MAAGCSGAQRRCYAGTVRCQVLGVKPLPKLRRGFNRLATHRIFALSKEPPESGGSKDSNAAPFRSIGDGSKDTFWQSLGEMATNVSELNQDRDVTPPAKPFTLRRLEKGKFWGQFWYRYYNWRQDTLSDLQLLLIVFAGLVLFCGTAKHVIVDSRPLLGIKQDWYIFWLDVYQVITLSFGQEFPDISETFAHQVFAVFVAAVGLATIALVIALVEQVVLEVVEDNVKRGTRVYETGHILLLGWCKGQRDLEVVARIVRQLCAAYKERGGTVLVVLTQRDKVEMEDNFRRIAPEAERFGTRIVFRKGNPLIPQDLEMVSANQAAAAVIVSDESRSPEEADAQSTRCAILLDELDSDLPHANRGHVVVELKTTSSIPILRYSCSKRFIGLPTGQLNARRLAKMVKHPVTSIVSQTTWNFESATNFTVQGFHELVGYRFKDLAWRFSDATVVGLLCQAGGRVVMNPDLEHQVMPGDELIMLRHTKVLRSVLRPAPEPLVAIPPRIVLDNESPEELGNTCLASVGLHHGDEGLASSTFDACPIVAPHAVAQLSMDQSRFTLQRNTAFMVPKDYLAPVHAARSLLVACWGPQNFMTDLLRELDHGASRLPPGSQVVFANSHDASSSLGEALRVLTLRHTSVSHVCVNPLKRTALKTAVDLLSFDAAIVLCDERWVDPDADDSNGVDILDQQDTLRLDSLAMIVQLNIRKTLEDAKRPAINIICQKVATEGLTRFEDRARLPLGVSVNMTSFSAKILSQLVYCPKLLLPFSKMGVDADLTVADASYLARLGESLSWWQLIARAQARSTVLVGYYLLPDNIEGALKVVVNPCTMEERSLSRVWNSGDLRMKLLLVAAVAEEVTTTMQRGCNLGLEEDEGDEGVVRAQWVVLRSMESMDKGRQQIPPVFASQGRMNESSADMSEDAGEGAPVEPLLDTTPPPRVLSHSKSLAHGSHDNGSSSHVTVSDPAASPGDGRAVALRTYWDDEDV